MKKHNRKVAVAGIFLTIGFSVGLTGCAGRYAGVSRATVLNYQTRPTYGHLYDVASAYALSIDDALAHDTLYPGLLADYGVALALMGRDGEACRMLNAEARFFPQSAPIVNLLKQRLLPTMVDDTTVSQHLRADLEKLQGWAYDSLTALLPLPHIASVIDSSDTARLAQQMPVDSVKIPIRLTANQKREMLAEEQAAAERYKQYVADSTAAAKQAVADARKREQADRAKAKQEQDKQRRVREKQRKQEASAKAKQRQAAAKAKAKQRKQEKKAKQQKPKK